MRLISKDTGEGTARRNVSASVNRHTIIPSEIVRMCVQHNDIKVSLKGHVCWEGVHTHGRHHLNAAIKAVEDE